MSEVVNQNEVEAQAEQSEGTYTAISEHFSTGPEQASIMPDSMVDVLHDARTVSISVNGAVVPVAIPVDRISALHQDYFKENYGAYAEQTYYVPWPVVAYADMYVPGIAAEALASLADREGAQLLLTHRTDESEVVETVEQHLASQGVITENIPVLDNKNLTEASVVHFTGMIDVDMDPTQPSLPGSMQDLYRDWVEEERAEMHPYTGTAVFLPELLAEPGVEERVWRIYNDQMDRLIENHPAFQRLSRTELYAMLNDTTATNIIHFEEGEPVVVMLGLQDIPRQAPWLRYDYLLERYGDQEFYYCPGMFSDYARRGQNFGQKAFELLVELMEVRNKEVRAYFECTNISEAYVPYKVIKPGFESTGRATMAFEEVARYNYVLKRLSR